MRLLLLAAVGFFAWVRPTEADLPGYDDAYYARKALEVLRTGDWLGLPHNGAFTYDNPPLGIWSMTLAFLALSPGGAAARFPSAAYGVLSAWLSFEWIVRRWGSRGAAFLGAAFMVSNPLFLKYLRRGMLDMGALFWCLLGLFLAECRPLSRGMQVLAGVAFGCAFLTKSLLPLSVPVAMMAGWWVEGENGKRHLSRAWGPILSGFALSAGSWFVGMSILHGKPFVGGHFVWLLWREGIAAASDAPRWRTLAHLILALLPMSVAFLWALGASSRAPLRREWRSAAAPFILAGLPAAVVMAAGARKIWYFLPALPGMAAAAGRFVWGRLESNPWAERRLVKGVAAVWLAGAASIALLPVPLHRDRTFEVRALAAELRSRTGPESPVTLYFPHETCRWDVRNALLWYADRPLQGCAGESAQQIAGQVGDGGWILTTGQGRTELAAAGLQNAPVLEQGELVLAVRVGGAAQAGGVQEGAAQGGQEGAAQGEAAAAAEETAPGGED
jgi:4-amino-4-deoxy-L-arabinose transferase-like glycosyltransferase